MGIVGCLLLLIGGVYVEHATLPSQQVMPLAHVGSGEAPYFSTALVYRRGVDMHAVG
jgi:hypothetical protein